MLRKATLQVRIDLILPRHRHTARIGSSINPYGEVEGHTAGAKFQMKLIP